MRQCLFCDQAANSKEHVWPSWILEKLKIDRPIQHVIGKKEPKILPKAEIQIRCVCEDCNNGWMSRLETENMPIIGPLMHDISIPLSLERQRSVALWAVKTAMVGDAVNKRDRGF